MSAHDEDDQIEYVDTAASDMFDDDEPINAVAIYSDYNTGCVRSEITRSSLNHGFSNIYRCTFRHKGESSHEALAMVLYSSKEQAIVDDFLYIKEATEQGIKVGYRKKVDLRHEPGFQEQRLQGHLPEVNTGAFRYFSLVAGNPDSGDEGKLRIVAHTEDDTMHVSTEWADEVMREVWARGMMKKPEQIVPDPWLPPLPKDEVLVAIWCLLMFVAICMKIRETRSSKVQPQKSGKTD